MCVGGGGSQCYMSILRNSSVALLNIRNAPVTISHVTIYL